MKMIQILGLSLLLLLTLIKLGLLSLIRMVWKSIKQELCLYDLLDFLVQLFDTFF